MFTFSALQKDSMIKHFNQAIYDDAINRINWAMDKWAISSVKFIESYSANLVFKGETEKYGPVIVKLCLYEDEYLGEVEALKHYDDGSMCRFYDVDHDQKVFIEERLEPGDTLFQEPLLEKRLEHFCSLHQLMARNHKPYDASHYKTYKDWIVRIAAYMREQKGWGLLSAHMDTAEQYFLELWDKYPERQLLHGDFHYYNILKCHDSYKIIDPKGVIGDPFFDVWRYLLNEFWDEPDDEKKALKMEVVFAYIIEATGYPEEDLRKGLYIENALSMSWNVESGATLDEQDGYILQMERIKSCFD